MRDYDICRLKEDMTGRDVFRVAEEMMWFMEGRCAGDAKCEVKREESLLREREATKSDRCALRSAGDFGFV